MAPMMVPATGVSTGKGATHDTEYKDCLAHGLITPTPSDLIQATFTDRAAQPRTGPPAGAEERPAKLSFARRGLGLAPILQKERIERAEPDPGPADRQPSREL